MKYTRKCKQCNKEFKTNSPNIIYCSCDCQDKYKNTNIWDNNKRIKLEEEAAISLSNQGEHN